MGMPCMNLTNSQNCVGSVYQYRFYLPSLHNKYWYYKLATII